MKNITVAVADEVYQRARVYAAERETSVSALVAGFLNDTVNGNRGGDGFAASVRRERGLRAKIKDFNGGDRLSREDLYRRGKW